MAIVHMKKLRLMVVRLSFRTVELLPIFTETMVIRRILMQSPLRRLRC